MRLEGEVDIHMGTLSKALGVAGGYIAGSRRLVDLLVNRARSFIFSTAPPPAVAAAATAASEATANLEPAGVSVVDGAEATIVDGPEANVVVEPSV